VPLLLSKPACTKCSSWFARSPPPSYKYSLSPKTKKKKHKLAAEQKTKPGENI